MTERNYRLIQPTDEYPTVSWCVIAALDCLSKKDVPFWAYGQYYLYYMKRREKSTTGDLYRYIMEKCIRDADGRDHDYIEYYLSASVEETRALLKLFRQRGDRVIMNTEGGHVVGLKAEKDGWRMVGFGMPTKGVITEGQVHEYLYVPEPYKRKRFGLFEVDAELNPNFVVVGPERSFR